MSSSDSDETDPGVQVRVSLKLAASVQDRSLEVPTEPIAVPADIGRKGLSAVLNHLLGRKVTKDEYDDEDSHSEDEEEVDEDEKLPPITFEFIVAGTNNRLLRKGVEKEARQYGISMEEAISITYFPATSAPDLSDEQEQLPDWISCMSHHAASSAVVSACYDGSIHVYGQSGESLEKKETTTAANGPIKSLATSKGNDGPLYIAASSLDHSLSIYTHSENSGFEKFGQCVQGVTSSSISALDFSRSSEETPMLLASGDGNGAICLWDVAAAAVESAESSPGKKKQKVSSTAQKAAQKEMHPLLTMTSCHSQNISGLSWGNHASSSNTHLVSGSWDHSIKVWDVEKQDCLLTLNGSRVVACLDTSYHTEGVVATGHPDCTIRLWDVRVQSSQQSATTVADTTFRPSHKAWVASVKWNPFNAFQLASTSHDGTVKLWDIRSCNPLHTMRVFPKAEKGMCLAWAPNLKDQDEKQHIFAGGSDCRIKHLRQ